MGVFIHTNSSAAFTRSGCSHVVCLEDLRASQSAINPSGDAEISEMAAAAAAPEPLLLTIADGQHRVVIEELGAFVRLQGVLHVQDPKRCWPQYSPPGAH